MDNTLNESNKGGKKEKQHYYQRKNNPKSEFEYFDIMYKINETLIQIITLNFGFDEKENKVSVAADFTAMTKRDQALLLFLGEKYGIKILNTPYMVLAYYKTWLLDTFKIVADNIISANSIYPVNEYEINIKRKYITDAMNHCEILIQIVQMCKSLFKCDENKLLYFVDLIIKERNRLKNWKASATSKYYNSKKLSDFVASNPITESFILKLPKDRQDKYIEKSYNSKCPIRILDNSYYAGQLNKNSM